MKPWLDDGDIQLYHGDSLEVLKQLPAGIAQTCVTSPPYWGLRDYGTGQWTGGDETCDHAAPPKGGAQAGSPFSTLGPNRDGLGPNNSAWAESKGDQYRDVCGRCGARRVDSQLGLEATPTEYVANMVALFREVWRVLRDDGTLWLNLGDSYAHGNTTRVADEWERTNARDKDKPYLDSSGRVSDGSAWSPQSAKRRDRATMGVPPGLKEKDLVGIPWRIAFALQADGWYLRSDIIWAKPNPMPESVTDRPTKSHEYLFLLTKQPRYFYDADAIRESAEYGENRATFRGGGAYTQGRSYQNGVAVEGDGEVRGRPEAAGRNRRSVWLIPTEPFPEAHFATYPQALVQPCILAGTSERGECVECGAPWRRVVATNYVDGGAGGPARRHLGDANRDPASGGYAYETRKTRVDTTTGWESSCSCGCNCVSTTLGCPVHEDTRPQIVLDPFIGSGTTALVARKHGRRCIGIDLSAEYLAIAASRTRQLSLLGAP